MYKVAIDLPAIVGLLLVYLGYLFSLYVSDVFRMCFNRGKAEVPKERRRRGGIDAEFS